MARAKEAVVLCLDVGQSMLASGRLQDGIRAVHALVRQKLSLAPKDDIMLILSGTQGAERCWYQPANEVCCCCTAAPSRRSACARLLACASARMLSHHDSPSLLGSLVLRVGLAGATQARTTA